MHYNHEVKNNTASKSRQVYPMPSTNSYAQELARIYIEKRGLNSELAFANHWFGSHNAGDGFARVVIPALNTQGIPYWQARLIGQTRNPETPRYQSPFYARLDSIIVVNPTILLQPYLVLSEGPFDALATAELGYYSIALMGNNPPSVVWDHIVNRHKGLVKDPVILMSDGDSLDMTAIWQAQLAVRGIKSHVTVPVGVKDVAAMPLENREKLMRSVWI